MVRIPTAKRFLIDEMKESEAVAVLSIEARDFVKQFPSRAHVNAFVLKIFRLKSANLSLITRRKICRQATI